MIIPSFWQLAQWFHKFFNLQQDLVVYMTIPHVDTLSTMLKQQKQTI
jgi:hypothetical protein